MTLPDLSRYDRIGLDTETTGLGRHDRPVGISIAGPDGKAWYLRWGHEQGGNNCSLSDVVTWARRELSDPHRKVCLHNAVFDMRMCRAVGVKVAGELHDSCVQAALLNEYEDSYSLGSLGKQYLGREKSDQFLNETCAKIFGGKPTRKAQAPNYWRVSGDVVEEYAQDDAKLALGLHDFFAPMITAQNLSDIYLTEQRIIMTLVKMYEAGVKIDIPQAKKTQLQLRGEHDRLMSEFTDTYGNVSIKSSKQMAELFDRLGLPYPRTEKGNPSITKEVLADLDHPLGAIIRRMRQLTHYDGTFINNYLLENVDDLGNIYPQFHQVKSDFGGTVTGRFSSAGGLNAQNIPARDEEWAPIIRGMFVPRSDEHQWLKVDYSQIEYRFFAHYAGGQLAKAYQDNPRIDFHDMVAEMTSLKRKQAKNINFGILYGMGDKKTARQLGVSLDEARQLLANYDRKVPEAKALYHQAMNKAGKRGWIRTWGGRVCRFEKVAGHRAFMGTHKALNKLLQGSAADLTKRAMYAVDGLIDWDDTVMHLTVHDELDFSVPKGAAGDRIAKQIKDAMEAFTLDVPIIAEAELGPDWGHTTKLAA